MTGNEGEGGMRPEWGLSSTKTGSILRQSRQCHIVFHRGGLCVAGKYILWDKGDQFSTSGKDAAPRVGKILHRLVCLKTKNPTVSYRYFILLPYLFVIALVLDGLGYTLVSDPIRSEYTWSLRSHLLSHRP
jgi:hypothetical protein